MKKILMITGILVLGGLVWYWFKKGKKPNLNGGVKPMVEVKAAAPAIPLTLGTNPETPKAEAKIISTMNWLNAQGKDWFYGGVQKMGDKYGLNWNQALALYSIIDDKKVPENEGRIAADYAGTTELEVAAWVKKYVA